MSLVLMFFRAILFKLGFVVKPMHMNWLITWRCNLACNYCDIGQANGKELKEGELSFEEIKQIVPQFKSSGARFVTFAGGEPLVYEDIFKVIKYCKEQKLITGIVTNGTLITDDVAKRLASCGLDHIHISLDAVGSRQDEIRNSKGCFERVDSAIKNLLKYKDIGKYHIGIACVISGLNIDNLEDVFIYAEKMSLDSVALQPFFIHQIRNQDMADSLRMPKENIPALDEKIRYLIKKYPRLQRSSTFYTYNIPRYFLDPNVKGTTCFAGGLTVNIFPDGTIGPCYFLQTRNPVPLNEKKLTEIMRSESHRTPHGTLITDDVAKRLAACGVDHIRVSLDAIGSRQDEIRNSKGCFERVDSAIKNLLKYKDIGKYRIGIACVVNELNIDSLDDIFSYAEKMFLDSVALQPSSTRQIRSQDMADSKQKAAALNKKIKYLAKKYPHLQGSPAFYTYNIPRYPKGKRATGFGRGLTIDISPEGTIEPPSVLETRNSMSLKEKKLTEIMHSELYRASLDRVRKKDCPTCWCAVVHEYNLFFRPLDILRSLRLLRVVKTGK